MPIKALQLSKILRFFVNVTVPLRFIE